MKELIEKILGYLPRYLANFGFLFVAPKRFIRQLDMRAENTFKESLLFLGISLVLVVIMTAPIVPPGEDLWSRLGANAVFYLLAVSLYAVGLRLAWRLVGGKARIRSFFVTYSYFFSVGVVIFNLFSLLSVGVLKVFDPGLYAQLVEAELNNQVMPDFPESTISMVIVGIQCVGIVFYSAWLIVGWGAYREINGLSKWRSFLAFIIMGLLGWLIAAVLYFVGSAVN